jgi:PqqD family protein of HPr-rel-A system
MGVIYNNLTSSHLVTRWEPAIAMQWRNQSTGRYYDAGESSVVYFDSRSGDTHLLSEFSAFLLQQLGNESQSIDDLVKRLSPSFEPVDVPELRDKVLSVLEELVSLDILKQD